MPFDAEQILPTVNFPYSSIRMVKVISQMFKTWFKVLNKKTPNWKAWPVALATVASVISLTKVSTF